MAASSINVMLDSDTEDSDVDSCAAMSIDESLSSDREEALRLKNIADEYFIERKFYKAVEIYIKVLFLDPSLCQPSPFLIYGLDLVARMMHGPPFYADIFTNPVYFKAFQQLDARIPFDPEFDDEEVILRITSIILVLDGLAQKIEAKCNSFSDDPKILKAKQKLIEKNRKQCEEYLMEQEQLEAELLAKKKEEALREEQQGNAAWERQDYENAILHLKRASELESRNATILANIARVHYARGDYKSCSSQCIAALFVGRCYEGCEWVLDLSKLLLDSLNKQEH